MGGIINEIRSPEGLTIIESLSQQHTIFLTNMTENKKSGFGIPGLGKIKELQDAFQKAQQVQAGAQQLQEELERMDIEGYSDEQTKLVTVVMSGNQEPRQVTIKPEAH